MMLLPNDITSGPQQVPCWFTVTNEFDISGSPSRQNILQRKSQANNISLVISHQHFVVRWALVLLGLFVFLNGFNYYILLFSKSPQSLSNHSAIMFLVGPTLKCHKEARKTNKRQTTTHPTDCWLHFDTFIGPSVNVTIGCCCVLFPPTPPPTRTAFIFLQS